MAEITAVVSWQRQDGEVFTDKRFGRGHQWSFDGGVTVRASSSPAIVPKFSDPAGIDPEEAFVASLSSCHMLTFLWIAPQAVAPPFDRYADERAGTMTENARWQLFVSLVTLKPRVAFSGEKRPDPETLAAMHHGAHDECFIANSVLTDVRIDPAA